jgi:glycine cleavage system aminomethyltransferase T
MFTLLGPAAAEVMAEWGTDGVCQQLDECNHATVGFNGSPVVIFKSSGLGPAVPGWTFVLDEGAAAEFWRKIALQVRARGLRPLMHM